MAEPAGVSGEARPRRPGRSRMTAAERREQLIDTARGLFAERGYDGTSIEEIAARAEVSKPVVYEHFGGKDGLYAVVVDREVDRFLAMATELLQGEDTMEKFEAAAVALLWALAADSPAVVIEAKKQWRLGALVAALSITTYGAAMLAYRLGATAQLAALRETSVLFGSFFAMVFLHERMTARRWLAAGIIVLGVLLLQAG